MAKPLYLTVYERLKLSITGNQYKLHEKLPSEKELAEQFDVSTITIKKALDMLRDQGFVVRKPRRGTIVTSQAAVISASPDTKNVTIGLVVTNFTDVFGTDILRSLISYDDHPVNVVTKISYGEPTQEDKQIRELLEMGVDGLIILPSSSEYTSPLILKLISKNFPIVVLDRMMSDLPICSVTTDNTTAASDLTKFLLQKGHRHIGIVTSDSPVTTIDKRVNGFLSAHIDENMAVSQEQILSTVESVIPDSKTPIEADIENIVRYLERNPRITAVIATEYNIASLVSSAIARMGKRIPEDYSLVCFDGPEVNVYDENAFVITHIQQAQFEIGQAAMALMMMKLAAPDTIKKVTLPYHLIKGNSVRELSNQS
ncbi:GntR family transcriptional regulator [Lacticaseibacillus suihuaensis]